MLSRSKIAALVLLACGSVHAALPPQAEEAFDRGVSASNKGLYLEAISDFQEARRAARDAGVWDTPEIYPKLGIVEAKVSGRELRAMCWLAAYLSRDPGVSDATKIKEQITGLQRVARENLRSVVQLTDKVGHEVGAMEQARWVAQTSLDTLVVVWDDFGDFSKAREVASSIYDAYNRSQAFHRVTWAQTEFGDFAGAQITLADQDKTAEAVSSTLQDSHWRDEARLTLVLDKTHLASAQAKSGDLSGAAASIAQAQQTAKRYMDTDQRSQAYRAIALAQADAGDLKGATETMLLINGKDARAEYKIDAQVAIADAQITAGDLAGGRRTLAAAAEVVDEIPASASLQISASLQMDKRSIERWAVSSEQCKAKDVEGARKTAARIPDSAYRQTLEEVVAQVPKDPPVYHYPQTSGITTSKWLDEVEGSRQWRQSYGLEEPLFTDYSNQLQILAAKGGDLQQRFAELQRAFDAMRLPSDAINGMLKEQFGL